jgi:hypothetical protein
LKICRSKPQGRFDLDTVLKIILSLPFARKVEALAPIPARAEV